MMIATPSEIKTKLIKPVKLSHNWMDACGRKGDKKVLNAFKRCSLALDWLDLPKKIHAYSKIKGGVPEKSLRVINRTTGIIGLFTSTLKVLKEEKLIEIGERVWTVLTWCGVAGLITKFFISVIDLSKALKKPLNPLNGVNIYLKMTSVLSAALGVYFLIFGGAAKIFLLVVSTSSFIIRNYKTFYIESNKRSVLQCNA